MYMNLVCICVYNNVANSTQTKVQGRSFCKTTKYEYLQKKIKYYNSKIKFIYLCHTFVIIFKSWLIMCGGGWLDWIRVVIYGRLTSGNDWLTDTTLFSTTYSSVLWSCMERWLLTKGDQSQSPLEWKSMMNGLEIMNILTFGYGVFKLRVAQEELWL